MYRKSFKRPLDIVLSLSALIILSPIITILAFLVKIFLGSPIIFKQQRPGLNEKIFTMYKFRTMSNAKDADGNLLPDQERLTRFGRFLRSSSLDELPELFNVLKGDMSLVGPRPLLVEYLPLYNEYQRQRHQLRPGITGSAQISGRNDIGWENKFNLDIEYLNNLSFRIDVKILLRTLVKVVKKEGIKLNPHGTSGPFKGNNISGEGKI